VAVLPIITGKDAPVLRAKTQLVGKPTKEIRQLAKDMEETVCAVDGLGLAAPQIDRSLRLCLCKIGGKFVALADPEITWKSEEMDIAEEGCLSLPGEWANVPRHTGIVVRYTDLKGAAQERKLKNLDARVVQHEVDHLDGVLIVDYAQLSFSGPAGESLPTEA
jgi:peptide deformylase